MSYLVKFIGALVLACTVGSAWAAPGDILFADDFERANLGPDWAVAGVGSADIGTQTSNSGTRSMFTAHDAVTATSRVIDLTVPAATLTLWIRRGADAFSEDTDSADDVSLEYLDDGGAWVELNEYDGGGTNGEIINASFTLPLDALHAGFRLRMRMHNGSGGPPANNGIGWDYWHFDDVLIEEAVDPNGALDCDTFDDGVGYTRVGGGNGFHGVNGDTFQSAGLSQFLNGGRVQVVSPVRDTSTGFLGVDVWVRRGSDAFSEDPDNNENLRIDYRSGAGNWVTLERFPGAGPQGEVFLRSYDLSGVAGAQHPNFQIRLSMNQGNGQPWDFWHVDDVCFVRTPVVVVAEIDIDHDQVGSYCSEETVTVTIRDGNGVPLSGYAGSITIDANTGSGDWRLLAGAGVFDNGTAGDGAASYTFDAADNAIVQLGLTYTTGAPSVDVEAVEQSTGLTDDDSEGRLLFSPTGFTVTASALPNPPPGIINDPIGPQTAGTDFVIHLSAHSGSPVDASCGVIEDYAGPKNLRFWQNWLDPASSAGVVTTIDGIAAGTSPATATPQVVNFSGGQAVVMAKYKDSGALRLALDDSAAGLVGSTNSFVSRPADLAIVAVETIGGAANPGAASIVLGSPMFAAAGEPFRLIVDALDAEGSRTPNFAQEASAEGVRVTSAVLVAPAGGRNGSADNGALINDTSLALTATPGRLRTDTIAFDEFGIVRLRASIADGDFLGTGDVLGSITGNVGRFGVAEFELTAGVITPSCGAFTYMDEPALGVAFTVAAMSALDVPLANYDAGLLAAPVLAALTPVAEDADDGIDLGGRLQGLIGTWLAGEFDVNAPNASFARAPAPDGAYANMALGVRIDDPLDTVALAGLDMNPSTTGDCALATNCVARRFGNTEIYYGRMLSPPRQGPETLPLAMDLVAQVAAGGTFVEHAADTCSDYVSTAMSLQAFTGNLNVGETNVVAPGTVTNLVLGRADPGAPPLLSAPGAGNDGATSVVYDVPSWLEFDWFGSGDTDPSGRATFGRYRGHDRIVFWRENTRP